MADSAPVTGSPLAPAVGSVLVLVGHAWARNPDSGATRELKIGDTVYSGELMVTGDLSALAIEFLDGSRLDLGRNSRAELDRETFDPAAHAAAMAAEAETAAPVSDDIDAIQQALLAGVDPTELEATAAGPGAGGGGDSEGSSFVILGRSNQRTTPQAGFDTDPISPSFDEPPPEDDLTEEEEAAADEEPPEEPENDLPIARDDDDFAVVGRQGDECITGNVITGEGTNLGFGGPGADYEGDAPAHLSSFTYTDAEGVEQTVALDPNDPDTLQNGVTVTTEHGGTFTIFPDGSYKYFPGEIEYREVFEDCELSADFSGMNDSKQNPVNSMTFSNGITLVALATLEPGTVGTQWFTDSSGVLDLTSNLSNLAFNPSHGAGVDSDDGSGNNEHLQALSSTGSQSHQEALVLDFGTSVQSTVVTLSSFVHNTGKGSSEQARWYAYDASGAFVATGVISAGGFDEFDGDPAHRFTTTIDPDGSLAFQYLVLQPIELSSDDEVDVSGANSTFFVHSVTCEGQTSSLEPLPTTETIEYTITDANGDSSSATLSIDLALAFEGEGDAHVLTGTAAHDYIVAQGAFDGEGQLLDGLGGNDILVGSYQDDILLGGEGDDILTGGGGNDSMTGGGGGDIFVFSLASNSGHDTLTDFDLANDVLRFEDVFDVDSDGLDLGDVVSGVNVDNGHSTLELANGGFITLQGHTHGDLQSLLDAGLQTVIL